MAFYTMILLYVSTHDIQETFVFSLLKSPEVLLRLCKYCFFYVSPVFSVSVFCFFDSVRKLHLLHFIEEGTIYIKYY